jgi:formylglycine-generating enzyme required for sulfatase activity
MSGLVEDRENLEAIGETKPMRALRGGSFAIPASDLRSAGRNGLQPLYRDDAIGVRIARTVR